MDFDEWWGQYEEKEWFNKHQFLAKMAWDYQQKEINRLKSIFTDIEVGLDDIAYSVKVIKELLRDFPGRG